MEPLSTLNNMYVYNGGQKYFDKTKVKYTHNFNLF